MLEIYIRTDKFIWCFEFMLLDCQVDPYLRCGALNATKGCDPDSGIKGSTLSASGRYTVSWKYCILFCNSAKWYRRFIMPQLYPCIMNLKNEFKFV